MPQAAWLDANLQTVAQMRLAVTGRLADSLACLTASRDGAALYLAGYVIEMVLKTAGFRVAGAPDGEAVKRRLGLIRSVADPRQVVALGPGARLLRPYALWCGYRMPAERRLPSPFVQRMDGHGLRFWREYLLFARNLAGLGPLPPVVDSKLRELVEWAADRWSVEMRYVDLGPVSRREAARFVWRARWLYGLWTTLER